MEFIDYLIGIVICTFILWLAYAFGHVQGMREAYRKIERRSNSPRRPRHVRNILDADILEEKNV